MNRAETERQQYMEQWHSLLLWGPGDVLANLRDSISVLPCIQRDQDPAEQQRIRRLLTGENQPMRTNE